MKNRSRGDYLRLISAVVAFHFLLASACPAEVTNRDPLRRKVRSQLRSFVEWLGDNQARGYVGEVGWPDDYRGEARQWNALARDWFDLALENDLWVSTWATGEWWDDYRLSIYEAQAEETGVDTPNAQAPVLESAASGAGPRIGINVNGGEFGSPITARRARFSNANPGDYNTRYHYDGRRTFDFLGSRGLGHVRIPFRWERIQPRLGRRLDRAELRRLRAAVGRAWDAGLGTILDVHNYGAYYVNRGDRGRRSAIGSRRVPLRHFANLWKRLSRAFKHDERVVMYALMTEPYGMPRVNKRKPAKVWEAAAQRAVSAIRSTGDRTLIAVPGYGWDALQVFTRKHPKGWIKDPAANFLYEVHHYWDHDYSGDYNRSYDSEADAARTAGW